MHEHIILIFVSAAYLDISLLQLNSSLYSYASGHAWYMYM